ncbi:hypothetical protein Rxycam_03188 [Rubrobacter xylanophilus DSM 9941]|uniref:class E sortase n=1 Tax=Rubrobacter xylanophilus TaxID=49319 RepID=UPI001C63E87B|nr:class E sortase [Rubrobacter xylanophilus]QYJ17340.1 hypothetical protein Rxycam_03188 [Rubrobacter xylanophilus DSM 9941]
MRERILKAVPPERPTRGRRSRTVKRSDRRKFRRRRRRAAFFAFVSLVALVLAGALLFAVETPQTAASRGVVETEKIARVQSPELAEAPEAAPDPEGQSAKAAEREVAEETVAVPDIPYNATKEEAEKILEEHGLELGEVKRKPNDEYEKGGVFYQDPLPGIEIKEGSRVGITLSSGPEKKEVDGEAPKPATNDLYLTVPKLGLYDNYVANTEDPVAMDNGAIKLPSTAFPWQENGNTYIAAHRIGYAGTPSYRQFYNLPSMQRGDEIILEDANGTTYTYEVTKVFAVMPQDTWVTNPQPGRDMVTLQTCVASLDDWWTITPGLLTSPPGPETARLVVQADRVDVQTT